VPILSDGRQGDGGVIEDRIRSNNAVHFNTMVLWMPWGLGGVSCIERCPHFSGRFMKKAYLGHMHSALNTDELVKRGSTVLPDSHKKGCV
jgi:hypothetical protein